MSLPVVGIDPGRSGGAVLLSTDGEYLDGYAWAPFPQRARDTREWLVSDAGGLCWRSSSLHEVGTYISRRIERATMERLSFVVEEQEPRYRLVVEGLFAGRNWGSALALAEYAALVYGPLTTWSEDPRNPERLNPNQWRPLVLGLPGNADGDRVSRRSRVVCAGKWPEMGQLLEVEHAREAACLSYAGVLTKNP